ncbi:MAG TPA: hypothetical protein DEO84_04840 [candidate division Zixibacteria bacterium]|jgi:hypothetical protein|nr:hypothetical protein [candidate division Zixibacteria bacterium]
MQALFIMPSLRANGVSEAISPHKAGISNLTSDVIFRGIASSAQMGILAMTYANIKTEVSGKSSATNSTRNS